MQTTMTVFNLIFVITLMISGAYGREIPNDVKIRRGGMTLYPQPRIGRSQNGRTWVVNPDETGYYHDAKRQGLIPFPRVGRSMPGFDRYYETMGGIWVVPRPGKFAKHFEIDEPLNTNMRDLMPTRDFTPRLGRENEEQPEEEQSEQTE